jgi:hypothetical protein
VSASISFLVIRCSGTTTQQIRKPRRCNTIGHLEKSGHLGDAGTQCQQRRHGKLSQSAMPYRQKNGAFLHHPHSLWNVAAYVEESGASLRPTQLKSCTPPCLRLARRECTDSVLSKPLCSHLFQLTTTTYPHSLYTRTVLTASQPYTNPHPPLPLAQHSICPYSILPI